MKKIEAKRIVIIDDDEMLTEALKDYLTREIPHDIQCFSTGEDYLQQKGNVPDVVILDYYLDTVDKQAATGIEILKVLKKDNPFVNIIMLSSQENYGLAAQTIQKGAVQYVIKGEDAFKEILSIVNEL